MTSRIVDDPTSNPRFAVHCRLLGAIDVRDARGNPVRSFVVQPKRVGLLAYLLLRGPEQFTRRDTLIALFWPESSDGAGRHSLSQALHALRKEFEAHVVARRGNDGIALHGERVWCDATEFERAVSEGRYPDALALYGGPLLDGFHVSGVASELERYFEDQRARLHAMAMHCARALTDAAELAGNFPLAARAARDAVRLDPLDELAVCRLMSLLQAIGDRAGAVRVYETLATRLSTELDLTPSDETQALAERIRRTSTSHETAVPAMNVEQSEPEPVDLVSRPSGLPEPPREIRIHRIRRAAVVGALLAGVVLATGVTFVATRGHSRTDKPRVLAVGVLRVEALDTSLSPRLLREILATDLARLEGVGVISAERMEEIRARTTSKSDTISASAIAARAGATDVVEGMLSGGNGRPYRLDVRLTDPGTGIIHAAQMVEARDVFALADEATAWVANDLGRPAPSSPLTEVTSTSLVARRFYDEGLRALNQGDAPVALRLFRAALTEDSTFVMAAYYASQSAWVVAGTPTALSLLSQAVRMARRASERERLFVSASWAMATNSPRAPAIAESLATRYPVELDGSYLLGVALTWSGDRGRAIPILQRTIERDAAMLDAPPSDTARQRLPCRACNAMATLIEAYTEGDSLDLAERAARDWTRRQPASGQAWSSLALVVELQGRINEALAAQREASRRVGHDLADDLYRARLAIRSGDFALADRLLTERAASGDLGVRGEALWWLSISLRTQRRFREASMIVGRAIAAADSIDHENSRASAPRMAQAQLLAELGRPREAARAFEEISTVPVSMKDDGRTADRGLQARRRAWTLALAAAAYADAHDTTQLSWLADSVDAAARQSLFGRDRHLASFVRGLLFEARHDYGAAEAAFRNAIFSPNLGYTRVNLALARVLLAQRRPREAVAILDAALHGGLEGSCYYVTRTDLQELMARAFAMAGEPDSARVYRTRVAKATARHENHEPALR
jgi:DNA-binding SARP family transcriptional activator